MDKQLKLTIVYSPCEEGGYTAYIKEMRGVISEGETKAEARENVLDALGLMLEADREEFEKENFFKKMLHNNLVFRLQKQCISNNIPFIIFPVHV